MLRPVLVFVIDPNQWSAARLGIKADMVLDYSREYWLDRAAYARAMAKETPDIGLRQQLIEIAASYDRLAKLEQERFARRDLPKAE